MHPNEAHHQIDYIMVQNRFRSGIPTAKTRIFPGANVGRDHDLVILNFRVRLKKIKKHRNSRLKFNLDRWKDPSTHESFQATVGGKVAALLTLDDGAEGLITKLRAVMTQTADEILRKTRRKVAALLTLDDGAEGLITQFRAVMTQTADEILRKTRWKTQPWVSHREIVDLCDQ